MSNTTITEILFSAAEVSRASGVEEHELRHFEPEDFGTPRDWRMCKTGGVIYTEHGVAELAEVMEARGLAVGAHSLRVLLKERRETPSAAPVARKAPGEPWYRHGGME